jgi:predicted porin
MKLKVLSAAIALAMSPLVQAQTSVTLYGIVDTGIQISKFGNGTQYDLVSGVMDGSRFGLKGTEELGNGYKAIFNLEARFETDSGENATGYLSPFNTQALTAGLPASVVNALDLNARLRPPLVVNPNRALFDRQAYVGLVTPVGGFLLGRQYTPGYEVAVMGDAFEAGTGGNWGSVLMGPSGILSVGIAIRASDAIQYRIEKNGFGASVMYAKSDESNAQAGTGTGSINYSKSLWGANLKYQANGLNVGLAYNTEDDQVGEKSLTTWTLGSSYEFGNAKIFAGYHRMKNDNPIIRNKAAREIGLNPVTVPLINRVTENAKLDADSYTLGMQYRIGQGKIIASVSHTDDNRPAAAKVTLFGLGYNYFLSKRTDLYVAASYARNNDTAQYALGAAGYAGGFTSEPGQDATAYQFGIRHRF